VFSRTAKSKEPVMALIVAGMSSLIQYLSEIKLDLKIPRPERCLCCGKSGLWLHGSYPRKADRSCGISRSLNPIFIQRFFCSNCRRTCSALPECIPPRRWYLWEVQQAALVLLLVGKSLYAAAKEVTPSRHTLGRWLKRFREQFFHHKDALCNYKADLGRTTGFSDFWQASLKELSLAQVMRLCHASGVPVP
jgi:transposase-like protein